MKHSCLQNALFSVLIGSLFFASACPQFVHFGNVECHLLTEERDCKAGCNCRWCYATYDCVDAKDIGKEEKAYCPHFSKKTSDCVFQGAVEVFVDVLLWLFIGLSAGLGAFLCIMLLIMGMALGFRACGSEIYDCAYRSFQKGPGTPLLHDEL